MPVYLIQRGEDGPVKIGHGKDPLRRMVNLQSGSPERLHLLGTLPGGAVEERGLHQRFSANQIFGEWYRFDPSMLEGMTTPESQLSGAAKRRRNRSKLDAYLEDSRVKRTDFAELIGVVPSHITGLCNGACKPSMRVLQRIYLHTGGAVTEHDFFDSDETLQCP